MCSEWSSMSPCLFIYLSNVPAPAASGFPCYCFHNYLCSTSTSVLPTLASTRVCVWLFVIHVRVEMYDSRLGAEQVLSKCGYGDGFFLCRLQSACLICVRENRSKKGC